MSYIKREAVAGKVLDGDELPSRRVLSALLGVNPNTVQKAYRILEEEGLIMSHSGAKSCMVLNEEILGRIRQELIEEQVQQMATVLRQMGVTWPEAVELMEKHWKEVDT